MILAGVLSGGCSHPPSDTVNVAPGIVFRRDREADVEVLDIDLIAAKVVPVVAVAHVEKVHGNYAGDAQTVLDWAQESGAVGGINGGFFGDTYDDLGHRKQIVGLAVRDGRVVAPSPWLESNRHPSERFLRSVIGFDSNGTPRIGLASADSTTRSPLLYPPAANRTTSAWANGEVWNVRYAVAGGPRLFANGERHIADKEERLDGIGGKVTRTFVAYDREGDHPRHLVLGRAGAMEFADVAAWLTDYYARAHDSAPRDAMCLDGGPSSQIVYRDGENGSLVDADPTGMFVPTAILLIPRK